MTEGEHLYTTADGQKIYSTERMPKPTEDEIRKKEQMEMDKINPEHRPFGNMPYNGQKHDDEIMERLGLKMKDRDKVVEIKKQPEKEDYETGSKAA